MDGFDNLGPDGPDSEEEDGMNDETVDSTSDQRVVNNTMRHAYRVLTDKEKQQMQALKDKGLEFIMLLHEIGETDPNHAGEKFASRELSIAGTKAEEAVMWAVKHVTR